MSVLEEVEHTRSLKPPKGVVYASPGVGKTTFGANATKPIIVDCENGANHVQVSKSPYLQTWNEILPWLEALAYEEHDYKTCVVDTIDWLLRRVEEHVSSTDSKAGGLEATLNRSHGGYGNGKQVLMNYVYQRVLPLFDAMVKRGIAVILLAHAARQNITNIDGTTVEKSTPDIHPVLQNTIVEWCDFVGAAKKDGDDRILILNETGQQLAKNRYNIEEPILLDWDAFVGAVIKSYSPKAQEQKENNGKS